jgi:hypothetical protein
MVRHEIQGLRGERRDELKEIEALKRPSRSHPVSEFERLNRKVLRVEKY